MKATIANLKKIYSGNIYVDERVLASAPVPKRAGELQFFNMGKYATAKEVAEEYTKRGLVSPDPIAFAAWNEENKNDPRGYFAIQWQDANGDYCYLTFRRWLDERRVSCHRYFNGWAGRWWLAGVPAPASTSPSKPKTSSDTLPLEIRIAKLEAFYARAIELIPSLEGMDTI